MKKKKTGKITCLLVRITGVEPARRGHQILSLARLPIPPLSLMWATKIEKI